MCTVCLTVSSVSFEPSTLYCNLLDYGFFQTTSHGSQLYAFSTAPPATKQPSMTTGRCSRTCPEANGQIYVSPYAETFHMSYGMRHGTPYLNIESVSTLEDCMDLCGASTSCSSVDFDQTKNTCYLRNNDSPPTYKASRFASTNSVGCSGACEGESHPGLPRFETTQTPSAKVDKALTRPLHPQGRFRAPLHRGDCPERVQGKYI
ncbi:hypothetical protein N7467_001591 [Penicillium canescens]|nr:hypothetical protein N7467_001591 [Penicillium canescens]